MKAFYSDIDPYACAVTGSRVEDGSLPPGDVMLADIRNLGREHLSGYAQAHMFAGIGGFPLGLAWAEWPDDLRVLTGGFPCQDVSAAGKGAGIGTKEAPTSRSGMFWELVRLAAIGLWDVVILENVGALSRRGLDVVAAALGEAGYVVPDAYRVGAWALGATHERERWWIVGYRRADADARGGVSKGQSGRRNGTRGARAAGPEPTGQEPLADGPGLGAGRERQTRAELDEPSTVGNADGLGHDQGRGDGRDKARPRVLEVDEPEGPGAVQPNAAGEPEREPEHRPQPEPRQCESREVSRGVGARGSPVQPDADGGEQQPAGEGRGQGGPARQAGYDAPRGGGEHGWCPPVTGPWRRVKDQWQYAGPPVFVYRGGEGLQERQEQPAREEHAAPERGSRPVFKPARPNPTIERGWPVPVLPGFVQKDWEFPRIHISRVGDPVSRLPRRVVDALNKSGVVAIGNSVVPEVVEAVARGIIQSGIVCGGMNNKRKDGTDAQAQVQR